MPNLQLDLQPLNSFLACPTPDQWVAAALADFPTLLVDHAHCEKKAASTAVSLMFRYPEHEDLVNQLSRLAREELRHFEQVLKIMRERGIAFRHLEPARYAAGLRKHIKTHDPERLIDTLIVGAFIEARSCERFSKIASHLDEQLQKFYNGLLASEARHFEMYLNFARKIHAQKPRFDFDERVAFFAKVEGELIASPDEVLRFHSGVC